MAVPRKLVAVPNAATRELWRIAESGAIEELEAVLQRADINARNKHGMTALMRAAYHGHVEMVRVLLEHGADPNVTRNDNFTALSLAAFFGHAEVVDLLMRHGARIDIAIRSGTSPTLWARARCFDDVARRLEQGVQRSKEPVLARPAPTPRVEKTQPGPIVVRTLKDPPEIWDLVHEEPRRFNASAAFFARIGSFKSRLVMAIALLVMTSAVTGGAFYLKSRDRSSGKPAPATVTATVPAPYVDQAPVTTAVIPEKLPNALEPATPVVSTAPVASRSRSLPRTRTVQTQINNEQPSVEAEEVPVVAPPTVVQVKTEPRSSDSTDTKKAAGPMNSQILSRTKTGQTKGKVIQWP